MKTNSTGVDPPVEATNDTELGNLLVTRDELTKHAGYAINV